MLQEIFIPFENSRQVDAEATYCLTHYPWHKVCFKVDYMGRNKLFFVNSWDVDFFKRMDKLNGSWLELQLFAKYWQVVSTDVAFWILSIERE